jgi:RimJ/RimL family protein N-acetyltransferase
MDGSFDPISLPQPLTLSYHHRMLTCADVAAIDALQNTVWQALPAQKKPFFLRKAAEQITRNLARPNQAIGVFDENNDLVGTAFLLDHQGGMPINGLTTCATVESLFADIPKAGMIATVMVHPQHRGKGIMEVMVGYLIMLARLKDYHLVAAEVVPNNKPSHKGFIHHGFERVGLARDPNDGTKLEFLALSLTRERLKRQSWLSRLIHSLLPSPGRMS